MAPLIENNQIQTIVLSFISIMLKGVRNDNQVGSSAQQLCWCYIMLCTLH